MQKFYALLMALALTGNVIAQPQYCQDQITALPGSVITTYVPPMVAIKNAVGSTVYVPVAGYYACHVPGYSYAPDLTANEGAAGNCHAYALYVGHGAPFFGSKKIVIGASPSTYTGIKNCDRQLINAQDEVNAMLAGFNTVTAASANTPGTVILYHKNGVYVHSAIAMGGGNLRQVNNITSGLYEVASMATVDARYPGATKTYHVLKNPYGSNATAGILSPCSNIKKCDDPVYSITGPATLCNNGNGPKQFSVPSGFNSYTWTMGPSLSGLTLNAASTNVFPSHSFPDAQTRYANSSVSVQYKVYGCSSPKTSSKNVSIENTTYPVVLNPVNPCPYAHGQLSLTAAAGNPTNIMWHVGGTGYAIVSGQGTTTVTYSTGTYPGGYGISFTNHCGNVGTGGAIMIGNCGWSFMMASTNGSGVYDLEVFPTVVHDASLNIQLVPATGGGKNALYIDDINQTSIRIFDDNGTERYAGKMIETDVKLLLHGFNRGLYYLEFAAGNEKLIKRFIVE